MADPRLFADFAELWADKSAGKDTVVFDEMHREICRKEGNGTTVTEMIDSDILYYADVEDKFYLVSVNPCKRNNSQYVVHSRAVFIPGR